MKLKFIIDKKYDKKFARTKAEQKVLEQQYKISLDLLEYSQNEYQKSWDKIGEKFSRYVELVTGYQWFYKMYYCVVSPLHPGISNWGLAPKIIRWCLENPLAQRRITAHELIISHFFEIYYHRFSHHKLSPGQIWALAEIAALALTSLTPETKNFWPWDNSGYYTNHNYPQILELQKKLKERFLKRKNFDEYIEIGIKLVKKYPKIRP